MIRLGSRTAVAAALVLLGAACEDGPTSTAAANGDLDLAPAFATVPEGFNQTANSFGDSTGTTFAPSGRRHHGGRGGFGFGSGLMGGGLGLDLLGGGRGHGHGFGRGFGFGGGPSLPIACAFTNNRVVCPPVTQHGVTVTRSAQYLTSAGVAQPAPDASTNSINLQVTIAGTRTNRDSSVTTINASSDQTTTGLAAGSTQRTVAGTSSGRESTVGRRDSTGARYNVVRVVGDTIRGVVIPVTDGRPRYPTAGTVIRSMSVTATPQAGGTATTSTRREVVTYNGTATATVVITENGTTRNCTLPLPRGRLSCQ